MNVRSLCTSLLAASLASAVLLSPVETHAASKPLHASDEAIEQIVVESSASVLTVDFDVPIGEEEAASAADRLSASDPSASVSLVSQDGTERTVAASSDGQGRLARPPLGCGNQRVETDSNGRFTIDYRCDLSPKRLQWSYKLSAGVQAIVVGLVTERGADWWKNGAPQPRNAPHTVGAGYLYHGTFSGVPIGSGVDYQDYLTFRHNVGSGGTGSVVWAGSVQTTRTLP